MYKTNKKICSIILIILLTLSALPLSGCGSKGEVNYPVNVANFTIKKEPQKIAVLSDSVADILIATKYETKLVARSEECTQPKIAVVPSVGSKAEPNVDSIKRTGAEIVFADSSLLASYKEELQASNIQVISILPTSTTSELEILFATIGTIVGGSKTGKETALVAFNQLTSKLTELKERFVDDTNSNTICYLYIEHGILRTYIKGTYGNEILEYTGATNIASNFEHSIVLDEILKIANPRYLFYADDNVLNYINNSEILSELFSIQNDYIYKMPIEYFLRQGETALDAVAFLNSKIYKEFVNIKNDNDTLIEPTTTGLQATTDGSEATTAPAISEADSVANIYGITITDTLELKRDETNDNIKILQQRLLDLGYLEVAPTGLFGDLTVAAITQFELANKLNPTGKATANVLRVIFNKNAIRFDDRANNFAAEATESE